MDTVVAVVVVVGGGSVVCFASDKCLCVACIVFYVYNMCRQSDHIKWWNGQCHYIWCGIYFVNVSVTISVGEFESLLLLIGLVGIVENI